MTRVLPGRRSLARSLALVATALTLAACGGDGPTVPADPMAAAAGTYDLVSVDGRALPSLVAASGANTAQITGGTVTLDRDGTMTQDLTYRTVIDGVVDEGSDLYTASWALISETTGVYIDWDGYDPVEGTLSGGALTFNDIGGTHVYLRR